MEYEPEMHIVHCNDPEENPIHTLRRDTCCTAEEPAPIEETAVPDASFFPFFCRPLNRNHF